MTPVETTVDAFLGGRIMVRQPRNGYRAGIDAVFLAAAAPCVAGTPCRVLDIGAGVGTVGLCVAARCPEANVMLLEREPDLATLARGNIADNKLAARVRAIEAGIGDPAALLSQAGLAPDSYRRRRMIGSGATEERGATEGEDQEPEAHAPGDLL